MNGVVSGWRIDPDGCRLSGRFWWGIDEALRVGLEGGVEGFLALGVDGFGLPVVDLVGGHQADADVVVIAVIPIEEAAAEGLCVLDAAETLGKLRLVFERLEAAFRKRIIVRCVRVRPKTSCGIA